MIPALPRALRALNGSSEILRVDHNGPGKRAGLCPVHAQIRIVE
jgi:hypothetical protein